MARYVVRPLAWREINQALDYYEETVGATMANRFLTCVMTTFAEMAEMPGMGVLCGFKRPATETLRRWRVREFESWLVFYQPVRDGVEIVHLLHGARDLEDALGY